MNIFKIIKSITKKGGFHYLLANIIYSASTFGVNLALPKILPFQLYTQCAYVIQILFLLIGIFQFGVVISLYYYIKKQRNILNIFYSLTLIIIGILILLSFFSNNPINIITKNQGLTFTENLIFYTAIIFNIIYVFNKGKNVADKDYLYMFKLSSVVIGTRLIGAILLYIINITSLSIILLILFIIPFLKDFIDYINNAREYIRPKKWNKDIWKKFTYYSLRVWIIGSIYIISQQIFLIATKGISSELTAAVAFSNGIVGIINLFNSMFSNFFISSLSSDKNDQLNKYISTLKKIGPIYLLLLLLLSSGISFSVKYIYPDLGNFLPIITFICLLKVGIISYLGMYSLVSKVINLLNIEIFLGIARIIIIYILCTYWHPESYIIWYASIMFVTPIPELILAIKINNQINRELHY